MKEWLKYFFGSFFSNRIVAKNTGRSFANAGLALILALVLLFLGLFYGNILAFPHHLENADDYTKAIQEAFDNGLILEIEDGVAVSNAVVNTFDNVSDAALYKTNLVELVVDTRDIDKIYVVVEITASRNGQEISYDDYLDLSQEEQGSYDLSISVTNESIDLAAFKDSAESYLNQVTNAQNPDFQSEIAEAYNALRQNQELGTDEFNRQLYLLYAGAYFPDLTEYSLSSAPTMHDYYSSLDSEDLQYLMIFSDMCVGTFFSKDSVIGFNGYFQGIDHFSSETESMKGNILNAFRSARGVTALIYVINLLQMFLYIVFLWVILSVTVFILSKIFKVETTGNLFGDLTVVGSFLLITSVISGTTGLISSFFASREITYMLATLSAYAVFIARALLFIVPEVIQQVRINRKSKIQS